MKRKTIAKANPGIFDYQNWVESLAKQASPLDRLLEIVDFEGLRSALEAPLIRETRGPGGRPAFDAVLMFKVLVLQRLYGLSDDQAEFQIKDRFSFQRFLGLSVADRMPDAKTIWKYREEWTHSHTIERCFALFRDQLSAQGLAENPGKIVDATFVEVPKQRNTREENAHIKDTKEAPSDWSEAKKRQKDTDAEWTKKNNQTFFGYKCHTLVSSMTKLIERYTVTGTATHDSQEFLALINPLLDREVWADSAYGSAMTFEALEAMNIQAHINRKGTRGHPLTDADKAYNREVSRIRSRVEHVFGIMTNSMDAMRIRCIGIMRATGIIGLNNLVYNMLRAGQLLKPKTA